MKFAPSFVDYTPYKADAANAALRRIHDNRVMKRNALIIKTCERHTRETISLRTWDLLIAMHGPERKNWNSSVEIIEID